MNRIGQVLREKSESRIGRRWDLLIPERTALISTLSFTATLGNKKVKYKYAEK